MQLNNKTVIVTGGANGMGREIAFNLLSKGANVAIIDLNHSALQETQKLAGDKAVNLSVHKLDITNNDAVKTFADEFISKYEKIDIIINNAGIIQPFVKINDLPEDKINKVFEVNFFGALNITKAFLPHLLKRQEAAIVNISSMGGYLPVPGQSIYGASKAAVKLMTEGLYAEMKGTNVHVSIVFPGAIGTDIMNNSGVKMPGNLSEKEVQKQKERTTSPNKAAEIIVNGILKNKSRIFVGSDAKFMDLLYRIAPTFATNFIAKKMKSLLDK